MDMAYVVTCGASFLTVAGRRTSVTDAGRAGAATVSVDGVCVCVCVCVGRTAVNQAWCRWAWPART